MGGRRLPRGPESPLRKHFVLQVARPHTCGHLVLQLCPEPGATRGARVGNGKAGKDKAALGTRWAAPLRNHATGFPKPLAQPLRFRISGLGPVQSRSFATPGIGLTTRDAQKKTPFSENTGRGWSPGKHHHLTVLAPTLDTLRPSPQHPQPRGVSRPRRFSLAPSPSAALTPEAGPGGSQARGLCLLRQETMRKGLHWGEHTDLSRGHLSRC